MNVEIASKEEIQLWKTFCFYQKEMRFSLVIYSFDDAKTEMVRLAHNFELVRLEIKSLKERSYKPLFKYGVSRINERMNELVKMGWEISLEKDCLEIGLMLVDFVKARQVSKN